LRVREHLRDEDAFCMTYGDGVGDVDIAATIDFHRAHGRLATLTAAVPPGRFGALDMDGDRVASFLEKPEGDGGAINAGFFVLSPKVLDYIENDMTIWEQEPLRNLASEGELFAYHHRGFWLPMDTLRDKIQLETLWNGGNAPWRVWS
jgi:glucose-1-phosphate cytidylyltransferase